MSKLKVSLTVTSWGKLRSDFMNLPNKLTIFRIILIPVFLILLLNLKIFWLSGVVFVIASLTDLADGKIARKNNLVTNFGKFADPLADKLLVSAALIGLCSIGKLGSSEILGAWASFIIIAREFMVTGIRLIAASDGRVIAAGMSGKVKTTIQMIAIVYILFSGIFEPFIGSFANSVIIDILVIASVLITLYSGIEYLIQNKDLLNTNK